MDELDIYDDLDDFEEQQQKKSKELEEWQNKYNGALQDIEKLKAENKEIRKKVKTMELNFQSLLDTAKAEIKRKDRQIEELRREKDNACFRRKPAAIAKSDHAHSQSQFQKAVQQQESRKDFQSTHSPAENPFKSVLLDSNAVVGVTQNPRDDELAATSHRSANRDQLRPEDDTDQRSRVHRHGYDRYKCVKDEMRRQAANYPHDKKSCKSDETADAAIDTNARSNEHHNDRGRRYSRDERSQKEPNKPKESSRALEKLSHRSAESRSASCDSKGLVVGQKHSKSRHSSLLPQHGNSASSKESSGAQKDRSSNAKSILAKSGKWENQERSEDRDLQVPRRTNNNQKQACMISSSSKRSKEDEVAAPKSKPFELQPESKAACSSEDNKLLKSKDECSTAPSNQSLLQNVLDIWAQTQKVHIPNGRSQLQQPATDRNETEPKGKTKCAKKSEGKVGMAPSNELDRPSTTEEMKEGTVEVDETIERQVQTAAEDAKKGPNKSIEVGQSEDDAEMILNRTAEENLSDSQREKKHLEDLYGDLEEFALNESIEKLDEATDWLSTVEPSKKASEALAGAEMVSHTKLQSTPAMSALTALEEQKSDGMDKDSCRQTEPATDLLPTGLKSEECSIAEVGKKHSDQPETRVVESSSLNTETPSTESPNDACEAIEVKSSSQTDAQVVCTDAVSTEEDLKPESSVHRGSKSGRKQGVAKIQVEKKADSEEREMIEFLKIGEAEKESQVSKDQAACHVEVEQELSATSVEGKEEKPENKCSAAKEAASKGREGNGRGESYPVSEQLAEKQKENSVENFKKAFAMLVESKIEANEEIPNKVDEKTILASPEVESGTCQKVDLAVEPILKSRESPKEPNASSIEATIDDWAATEAGVKCISDASVNNEKKNEDSMSTEAITCLDNEANKSLNQSEVDEITAAVSHIVDENADMGEGSNDLNQSDPQISPKTMNSMPHKMQLSNSPEQTAASQQAEKQVCTVTSTSREEISGRRKSSSPSAKESLSPQKSVMPKEEQKSPKDNRCSSTFQCGSDSRRETDATTPRIKRRRIASRRHAHTKKVCDNLECIKQICNVVYPKAMSQDTAPASPSMLMSTYRIPKRSSTDAAPSTLAAQTKGESPSAEVAATKSGVRTADDSRKIRFKDGADSLKRPLHPRSELEPAHKRSKVSSSSDRLVEKTNQLQGTETRTRGVEEPQHVNCDESRMENCNPRLQKQSNETSKSTDEFVSNCRSPREEIANVQDAAGNAEPVIESIPLLLAMPGDISESEILAQAPQKKERYNLNGPVLPLHATSIGDENKEHRCSPSATPRNDSQIELKMRAMFESPVLKTAANHSAALSPIANGNVSCNETVGDSQLEDTGTASLNSSVETKKLSLGSSDYLFEKVSENVVNLFIRRKRSKKKL